MTRLRSLSGLVLLVACGSGGGSSADSTGDPPQTSTASTTATGGGTTADATSASPTTSGAASTSSTAGPGETSTAPSTSAPATATTGEPGTTSASTGGTSSGESTGGPVGACQEVSGDHGPCDALLGVGLRDGACQYISGCSCEPDCAFIFADPVACATTCAAAGECQQDEIDGAALAPDDVGPGTFCDEVDACVNLPELQQLFPEMTCEPGGMPCGGENCHLQFAGELTPEVWEKVCAASLLPGVDQLYCVVFGP